MTSDHEAGTAHRRTPAGTIRALCGPFLQLYARGFFASVALQVFVVMLLVEAIFLAERFPIVFRAVFKNNADPIDTTWLFLCNTTQVFDLALAIAILMAVYWTILRMRENRELLVLFAAGTGPYQLVAVVMAIAVAGQLLSLTMSGVIDPSTRYAEREILFNASFRALRNGINTGQFYKFPNRVAYAPARTRADGAAADQTRGLMVYERVKPGTFRVITADRALLDGPNASGRVSLRLGSLTAHTFATIAQPVGGAPAPAQSGLEGQTAISQTMLSANDLTQQMSVGELLTLDPRGTNVEELTIFDQLRAKSDATSLRHRQDMRLLGERFARSLLCLLAPLIALAAICFTSRATNYFVLPVACMGLMGLNMTSGWLIKAIVPVDPLGALSIPAAVTALLSALLLAEIIHAQGRLAHPQLARP
jgi:lipopolysaccharide export system permease protein